MQVMLPVPPVQSRHSNSSVDSNVVLECSLLTAAQWQLVVIAVSAHFALAIATDDQTLLLCSAQRILRSLPLERACVHSVLCYY
jgi:hypothetical protein